MKSVNNAILCFLGLAFIVLVSSGCRSRTGASSTDLLSYLHNNRVEDFFTIFPLDWKGSSSGRSLLKEIQELRSQLRRSSSEAVMERFGRLSKNKDYLALVMMYIASAKTRFSSSLISWSSRKLTEHDSEMNFIIHYGLYCLIVHGRVPQSEEKKELVRRFLDESQGFELKKFKGFSDIRELILYNIRW
jgi:hypothetical protein